MKISGNCLKIRQHTIDCRLKLTANCRKYVLIGWSAGPLITIRPVAKRLGSRVDEPTRNRRWIFNRPASIKSYKISSDPLNCSSPSGHVLAASFSIMPRSNEARLLSADRRSGSNFLSSAIRAPVLTAGVRRTAGGVIEIIAKMHDDLSQSNINCNYT